MAPCAPEFRLSAAWLRAGLMALAGLALAFAVQADTLVSGILNGDNRWTLADSPYRLTGDVVVQNGATLNIDAGVTVYMAANTNLIVQSGGLQVLGTAAAPIRVLSDKTRLGQVSAPGDWNQWLFTSGAGAVRLEHMQFKDGRGLAIEGSAPVLNHVDIRDMAGAAITLDLSASPSGVGLSASGCGLNGILVPAGEIQGSVTWGLRGIPYVLASGTVSVGASPTVSSVSPASMEQGQTAMLTVNGSRLGGLSKGSLDGSGLTLTTFPGGSSSLLYFMLEAATNAPLGARKLTLQVDAGEVVVANAVNLTPPLPAITTLSPSSIEAYKGVSTLTLTGRNFTAASEVLVNGAAIPSQYSNATTLTATLPNQTAAAVLPIQVRNPTQVQGGSPYLSNSVNLSVVLPTPPVITLEPTPLALPPDSLPHEIVLRLSKADYKDNTLSLSMADAAKASVSPASLTIPAGQTSTRLTVTPRAVGTTSLTASASGLATVSIPVYVTTDFAGVSTGFAAPVGVLVGSATPEPVSVQTTVTHANVGVTVGAALTGIMPRGMALGSSRTFTVAGVGLPADAQVSVVPNAGVTISGVDVAADGRSLQFTLSADANAAVGPRRIVVRSGTGGLYTFTDPARSFVTLVAGIPEIDSIEPIQTTPGSLLRLLVRGRNLQAGQVNLFPADGLTLDTQPTIDAAGTSLQVGIQVAANAATGARRVQVLTAGGATPDALNAANTLNIVSQIQTTYAPLLSPQVGVLVGSATAEPVLIQVPILNRDVGVLVGAGIESVAPRVGTVGTALTVTVTGRGLDGVASVALLPATGITLGTPSVNADGTELSFTVAIDAGAALGPRRLSLRNAAGLPLTYVRADGGVFLVTAPVAEIASVAPQVVLAGSTVNVTLLGRNFINVNSVRLEPADGVTINGPYTSNADGSSLSFALITSATASSSQRTVIVNSAGGDSSSVPQAGNTLRIASQLGPVYAAITAPVVGVTVGESGPAPQPYEGALMAPAVGVMVGTVFGPEAISTHAVAPALGVVVGSAVASMTPGGWLQGASGNLLVTGIGLQTVTGAAFSPGTGLLPGTPVASADGGTLSLSLSIAPDAQQVPRKLILSSAAGKLIWLDPRQSLVSIGRLPSLTSVSPIVWSRGATLSFTVRGSNLQGVTAVAISPGEGVSFSGAPVWSSDALGELLTVTVYVAPGTATGERAIFLQVPGGATSATPDSSNTVRIVAPN